jgi:hypothetical protein
MGSYARHRELTPAERAAKDCASCVPWGLVMLRRVLLVVLFGLFAGPAFAGSVSVLVDLSDQKMVVKINGYTEYVWPVSTGRKGYRTPTGTYHPVRMYRDYYSKKYDDAPMPYSIFYSGGFAIHGTESVRSLGRPASHGCVRLHPRNAALLYDLVQDFGRGNTTIRIRK